MSAKNNLRFSPVLGHKEQNQCWFLLRADLYVMMFFQHTQQSRETDTNKTKCALQEYKLLISQDHHEF